MYTLNTYLSSLRNKVFKLLPMREAYDRGEDNHLDEYLENLCSNFSGAFDCYPELADIREVVEVYNNVAFLKNNKDVEFVYPVHPNPNVRKPIHQVFGDDLSNLNNMFFIEPLQYLEFVYLMEKSTIVLTDSGGIQEEAPGLGKPVLVMRDTTERPEALSSGTVHLVGTDYNKIVNEVSTLLDNQDAYNKMSQAVNPYGDGKACERIVKTLMA